MRKQETVKFELLTCDEAAKRLRVSRSMIYKLTKRGELPVVKICTTSLIRDIDLDRFIDDHLIL